MKLTVTILSIAANLCAGIIDDEYEPEIIRGGYSGTTTTSRYWDCCKPTCGWKGNTATSIGPVRSCDISGTRYIEGNTESVCRNGNAYMCNNQQSKIINSNLAFGFAAAAFANPPENMCCTCLLLTFQKGQWGDCSGKKMIVQITNTGGSRSTGKSFTNIEIAMPGGGVGAETTGCMKQWNTPSLGWGDQYGGVRNKSACYTLPRALQLGCLFRWDFLNGCSNPPAIYQQVACPRWFVETSGCNMR